MALVTAAAGIMIETTLRKTIYGREIGTVKNAAPITLHVDVNASSVELQDQVLESRDTTCVIVIEGGIEIMDMKMIIIETLIMNLGVRHHGITMTALHPQVLMVINMEADMMSNQQVVMTTHLEATT